MQYFGSRFIIEFLVFAVCQIIFLVFAIVFLKKCVGKYRLKSLLGCIACVVAFIVIISFSINYWLDFPYYIRNEYITAEVTTLEYNTVKALAPEEKGIRVRDNATNKEFRVQFYTAQIISVGDVYEIVYLPHTKMAVIIKIISSS